MNEEQLPELPDEQPKVNGVVKKLKAPATFGDLKRMSNSINILYWQNQMMQALFTLIILIGLGIATFNIIIFILAFVVFFPFYMGARKNIAKLQEDTANIKKLMD